MATKEKAPAKAEETLDITGLRVLSLSATNFMPFEAAYIELAPTGITIVHGNNGAGKSAALQMAKTLAGKKGFPDMPLKKGAEKCTVDVGLGTPHELKILVERTITDPRGNNNYLTVKDVSGKNLGGQTLLNEILAGNDEFFDPLVFCSRKPGEQCEILLAALPDLTAKLNELEAQDVQLEDDAKIIRAEVTKADGAMKSVGSAPPPALSKQEPLDVSKLVEELNVATKANTEHEILTNRVKSTEFNLNSFDSQIQEAEQRVTDLKAQRATQVEVLEGYKAKLAESTADEARVAGLNQKINTAGETNKGIAEAKQYKELTDKVRNGKIKLDTIKSQRAQLEIDKRALLTDSALPIDGLEIVNVTSPSGKVERQLSLDGIPLSQVNTAKKLEIGVLMAIAMSPNFRTLLIDEGSALDPDNIALLTKLTEQHDFNILMTRVSGESGILIRDGQVVDTEDSGNDVGSEPTASGEEAEDEADA